MANSTNNNDDSMSVREAGQKGGKKTSQTHGEQFYHDIGTKGGQKVRRLVEEGKEAENQGE